jgi:hypothetical protein
MPEPLQADQRGVEHRPIHAIKRIGTVVTHHTRLPRLYRERVERTDRDADCRFNDWLKLLFHG